MNASQQLVDDLDRAALTWALADGEDVRGDRLEHGLQAVEGGLGACCHHCHRTGLGLDGAAGDGGIEYQQPLSGQLACDGFGLLAGDGGADHDGGTRPEATSQPLLSQQNTADLRGIDHQQQYGIEPVCDGVGIRPDTGGTGDGESLAGRRVEIDAMGVEPGPQAGKGGAHAHGAKADDGNLIRVRHAGFLYETAYGLIVGINSGQISGLNHIF